MEFTGIMAGPSQAAVSVSPAMHNAAFGFYDLDWLYVRLPVADGNAAAATRSLVQAGFRGWNVTMPHKISIIEALDDIDDSARRIGAVNTVDVSEGRSTGRNTDAEGFLLFLRDEALAGAKSAAVIGAGGAARAVIAALSDAGVASIHVIARDPGRARNLQTLAEAFEFRTEPDLADFDLLINATPADLPDLPVDIGSLPATAAVVDLVYQPLRTKLVEAALALGLRAFGGLGMLVHQAARSFEIWTAKEAPIGLMREAALGQLDKRREHPQAPA